MGVPARDLSEADFAELPEFAQAYLKAHLKLPNALYEEVAGAKAASRAPAPRNGKATKRRRENGPHPLGTEVELSGEAES